MTSHGRIQGEKLVSFLRKGNAGWLVLKQAGLDRLRELSVDVAHAGEPDLPVPVNAVPNRDTAPC